MVNKFKISFDVETTGQSRLAGAMIEFSVVIIENETMQEYSTFKRQMLVPNDKGWDLNTVLEFWGKNLEVLNNIKKGMLKPEKVMNDFVSWLDTEQSSIILSGGDLKWISDTSGFDYAWLDSYIEKYTDRPGISYVCVDTLPKPKKYKYLGDPIHTRSFYTGVLFALEGIEVHSTKVLREKLKLHNKSKFENNHDSLSDARALVCDYLTYIQENKK